MTYTPCSDPTNDPDDWFISSHGKQYRDDELVTWDEAEVEHQRRIAADGDHDESLFGLRDTYEEMAAERLKANLVRRRHAKDKCFTQCEFRASCLALSMGDGPTPDPIEHGTFGGYYEEERFQLLRLRNERRRGSEPLD